MKKNKMSNHWLDEDENRPVLNLTGKTPIMVDQNVKVILRDFLIYDLAGTGINYSQFILKAVEMWRGMIYPNLPTLADTPHDCPTCGNSGFSGYGSGYDAVCSDCGGQSAMVNP